MIVEVAQNLHFEGVMLSFIIIAFYFILKKHYLFAALFLSFAIQIKIIPFLILPFLLRWIGWKNAILIWSVTLISTFLISIILIDESNVFNFLKSIQLYFRQFEFNSLILHWYIQYGEWKFGYNRIQTFGPYLSRIATEIIIILAWYGNHFNFQTFSKRIMFALFFYYLLSSTVHPWYLILMLFFSIFTSYKFILVWSFTVFLSYISYATTSEFYLRVFQALEYFIVFWVLFFELLPQIKRFANKFKVFFLTLFHFN